MTRLRALWARYGKTAVAVAGALVTLASIYYGGASWWPLVVAALTAAGVHVAPASSTSTRPPAKPGNG